MSRQASAQGSCAAATDHWSKRRTESGGLRLPQALDQRVETPCAIYGRNPRPAGDRQRASAVVDSTRKSGVRVRQRPERADSITFDSSDGAWSFIGTDASSIPTNEPTMNLGFLDGGTAAHEFGHAIGLAHEHQNPAGGIQWNEAVVIRELAGSPNFWDEATTRHNVLRKYSVDQINGTAFDPDSIMLYFFPASWTLNGIGTKANDVLSKLDKEFIAGAKMYPKTGDTTTT